ncbi:MAG: LD-carboxypeptidase [Clostridiales bacterium]|nr:LD-carboxypeptidase [Clostridiales bacterium]
MRYGKFLPDRGTIGFVAPSFGCNIQPYRSAFENARRIWTREGYQLDLGPNCFAGEGVGISNTPQLCGKELTDYYRKEDNDCLISCGGGELMCEILDYVDWEEISRAPAKWYMGFSDNTNMTYLLATLCDTASVYGPCAASFGMEPMDPSLQDAFSILTGKNRRIDAQGREVLSVHGYPLWEKESVKDETNPLASYHLTEPGIRSCFDGETFMSGEKIPGICVQGRLIGGCMDCLVNLLGTCYDRTGDFLEKYKEDGFLWFLEACDLNVFSIRRAMWQMEHAGWFKYVKGFLIGRPLSGMESQMNLDRFGAVLEVAGKKKVPVFMDLDIGHLPPMMPLITGSFGTVTVEGNEVAVDMELRP